MVYFSKVNIFTRFAPNFLTYSSLNIYICINLLFSKSDNKELTNKVLL